MKSDRVRTSVRWKVDRRWAQYRARGWQHVDMVIQRERPICRLRTRCRDHESYVSLGVAGPTDYRCSGARRDPLGEERGGQRLGEPAARIAWTLARGQSTLRDRGTHHRYACAVDDMQPIGLIDRKREVLTEQTRAEVDSVDLISEGIGGAPTIDQQCVRSGLDDQREAPVRSGRRGEAS